MRNARGGERVGRQPAQLAQRVGSDLQPFERGGEHRPPARFEVGQQPAQHAVVLEDSRNHVREDQRGDHQRREEDDVAPSVAAPHEPEDQRVERQPHRRARDGQHQTVHEGASVEVQS